MLRWFLRVATPLVGFFSPTRRISLRQVSHRAGKGGDAMRTSRERIEEKRREKLDLIREQVENGTLVIRRMTAEERRRYPPRPVTTKVGRPR